MNSSRRDLLKFGAAGGAALTFGLGAGIASAQGSELTIAYNVNLPSLDPTVGPSAVNPTIQGIYQSVFDMYIGAEARSLLHAGPPHRMGLERRPHRRS